MRIHSPATPSFRLSGLNMINNNYDVFFLFFMKPGDRVQVIGMYRCLPSKRSGFTPGTFR